MKRGTTRALGVAVVTGLALGAGAGAPDVASACGGFFCNGGGGGGPTPVVQAAERVIFEQRSDGKVRTYVQIAYQAAPIGFSWIIPVQAVPEIGVADPAIFDQLDAATNPQFRFISPTGAVSGGGGGVGCGASGDASPSASRGVPGGMTDVDDVHVWGTSRVGDYETATLSGDTAEALLGWLRSHGYDIPAAASDIVQTYVDEGHLFVAFRYSPLMVATGVLQPIVLEYSGAKPCVPLRITAIATSPVLDVMILAFGAQRAAPAAGWMLTEPNYDAVRQDFSSARRTTYDVEVLSAVGDAGGRAFVMEYAAPTRDIAGAVSNIEAQALLGRAPYVTRFYTRLTPEAMTVDPEFDFTGGPDVGRLHVIDLSRPTARAERDTPTRFAAAAPIGMALAALVFAARRLRRKHGA